MDVQQQCGAQRLQAGKATRIVEVVKRLDRLPHLPQPHGHQLLSTELVADYHAYMQALQLT